MVGPVRTRIAVTVFYSDSNSPNLTVELPKALQMIDRLGRRVLESGTRTLKPQVS